ncbi:MAG: preprotein translocase subunit SecA [Eubacteriales bacterium]|uniref:preprotein translocase subunit SecA n=1 Tax=Fenollaria sp. TaxID=1965292 RepID=UPI002A74DE49|nr:preprotein translocase subunit SecA [Fenollaria sp.]MDD7339315.1 preprotein translocase subunit SecA [Eubacteriales bacterium]MDY3105896.1 preprotein translocase subunit SecA [Fenollaria sp.]
MGLFSKIFGSTSDRAIKKNKSQVEEVMALEDSYSKLSDEELKDNTNKLKERLKGGDTLDDILPEAFATVREASKRVLGMTPYRVQVEGGIILHQGRIAEMKTGEGKTLVETMPAYLNALEGKGVHIVTVNDYLAKRDRDWMGKVFEYLGLSVGCIVHDMPKEDRKIAYASDITYGTNNEFGFDYLRDNMVIYKENMVQRELNYAIVDEVDSILIDEARTPLIISGQGDKSTDLYELAKTFVSRLSVRVQDPDEHVDPLDRFVKQEEEEEETKDYVVNEKDRSVLLTELGTKKAEEFFKVENLSDIENMEIIHHINQAMKARSLMKKDKDYVVKDGEIIIVDEFTGRLMFGRRYSDGLHQAIEAKEGLEVRSESKTLATITFQNYFRMYKKLSGMTGTAKTEEEEFQDIYHMDVIEIPTNKPVIRVDNPDEIYRTEAEKFGAVIDDIKARHATGQPVLVGTISIEKSEELSKLLKKTGIKHEVLNAKFHDKEAEIVAQAGRFGQVTIATNMAGRGTDIILGGNPEFMAKQAMRRKGLSEEEMAQVDSHEDTKDSEILKNRKEYDEYVEQYKKELQEEKAKVIDAGGLHIIGTERHESRRIDNQLRGRAGRQGDPGSSTFYISAEDDLMRLFGGDRFKNAIDMMKMPEGDSIKSPVLTRLIESAQRKVEGNNYGIRKHVLKYDDVMNKQREVIYAERKKLLEGADFRDNITAMIKDVIAGFVNTMTFEKEDCGDWDFKSLFMHLKAIFDIDMEDIDGLNTKDILKDELIDMLTEHALKKYEAKENEFTPEKFREIERIVLLQVVDDKWMDHIDAMDQLKQGIGLRSMAQEDPARAYAIEGFDMFEAMNEAIKEDTLRILFHVEDPNKVKRREQNKNIKEGFEGDNAGEKKKPYVRKTKKVGRNDPCPCGSGKKYKNCCGRNE